MHSIANAFRFDWNLVGHMSRFDHVAIEYATSEDLCVLLGVHVVRPTGTKP